jgi:hypothetical protein
VRARAFFFLPSHFLDCSCRGFHALRKPRIGFVRALIQTVPGLVELPQ